MSKIAELQPGRNCIGVGVFALIQNAAKEILLCRSVHTDKKNDDYAFVWSMIGGTVEYGETLEDALIREVIEETNLPIKVIEFLNYNEYLKPDRHWVAFNFLAQAETNRFVNIEPEKQADLQWFRLTELPKELSPYTRSSLEAFNKEKSSQPKADI